MRLIVLILILFASIKSWGLPNTLNISLANGEKIALNLYDKPVVKFTTEDICISWAKSEVRISSKDISDFFYSEEENASIKTVDIDTNNIQIDKDGIHVPNYACVAVYSLDGSSLFKSNNYSGLLSLDQFNQEILIININNHTLKIKNHLR